MTDLRLDRVIRRTAADSNGVYSLLLTDAGLYVFYTGIVGGLVFDDDRPRQIVVDDQTLPLIETMIKSEARVKSLPPEQLVKEDGHTLILFASMTALRSDIRQDRSTLVLETDQETFDFHFTVSNDAEVSELVGRLKRHIEETADADPRRRDHSRR